LGLFPGESVAGTIAEMSALFYRLWANGATGPFTGSHLVFGSAGTMRVSGFSKKLFSIAWAALGAIATIGWFYFIAILFRFIINLL
jgi:hypothetical protein